MMCYLQEDLIRSALDAVMSFGRPKSIQLLTLINRRFTRDLPIRTELCW